jgi:hypothetical protein
MPRRHAGLIRNVLAQMRQALSLIQRHALELVRLQPQRFYQRNQLVQNPHSAPPLN